MRDLQSPGWIKFKAALFFMLGVLSLGLLLAELPSWRAATLLVLAIWSFCRLYYFAFYVIEKYVDRSYKFSGLWSFLRYLLREGAIR